MIIEETIDIQEISNILKERNETGMAPVVDWNGYHKSPQDCIAKNYCCPSICRGQAIIGFRNCP